MILNCKECNLPLKLGKTVWFMHGKSYHPECVQDNLDLYKQWILNEFGMA